MKPLTYARATMAEKSTVINAALTRGQAAIARRSPGTAGPSLTMNTGKPAPESRRLDAAAVRELETAAAMARDLAAWIGSRKPAPVTARASASTSTTKPARPRGIDATAVWAQVRATPAATSTGIGGCTLTPARGEA